MHKLNLIPEEFFNERRKKRQRFFYAFLAFLTAILLLLVFTRIYGEMSELHEELQEVDMQLNFYRSAVDPGHDLERLYSDLQERRRITNNLITRRSTWSSYIQKITNSLPDKILLLSINIGDGGNGVIRGTSPDNLSVAYMIENLRRIDGIGGVKLGFIQLETEKDLFTFEIYFQVQGNDALEN
ncbi:PilN domain-containing protein [Thermosediminibacter litoriperuensis]|uniref:Type IV pilus assembly protein PilN n=1 Tax=Thermosediminibacter litoriperuensis TaxID=291989 RepID=A0A5S5AKC8_9FIRM|nr:PilN domain-containing protein [Thermosediminibacter litoriperuensis]TYP51621.1 type IV pilus assembly protein PilN [Thermosediminibacter litoriperuensis]